MPCGVFTAASGTISDGPGQYLSSAHCTWIIAPADASQVTLRFTEFRTEENYDFITVYECTSSCTQLQRMSNTQGSGRSFSSTTGYLKITFTSDGSDTQSGFTALWESVSDGSTAIQPVGHSILV